MTLPVATWDANAVQGRPGTRWQPSPGWRSSVGATCWSSSPTPTPRRASAHYVVGAENVPVEVPNTAPTAWAVATPTEAETGADVALDGTNSTDAETPDTLTYAWDFGDGGDTVDATTPTATVSYSTGG